MTKISPKTKTLLYGNISLDINDLVGRTVARVEGIRSEYGRTYEQYIGITCTDGTRVMLWGDSAYDPKPPLEYMKKSDFFTTDELVAKAESDIREDARHQQRQHEQDLADLKRIQERLGLK
jgi:hypothetical protein